MTEMMIKLMRRSSEPLHEFQGKKVSRNSISPDGFYLKVNSAKVIELMDLDE